MLGTIGDSFLSSEVGGSAQLKSSEHSVVWNFCVVCVCAWCVMSSGIEVIIYGRQFLLWSFGNVGPKGLSLFLLPP